MTYRVCDDCGKERTFEEVYWYGHRDQSGRCEDCEQAWSDRMGRWMRGETVEPELDRMFGTTAPRTP